MAGFASGALRTGKGPVTNSYRSPWSTSATGTGGVGPTSTPTTSPIVTTGPSWTTGKPVKTTKDAFSNQILGDMQSVYGKGPLGLSTYAGLGNTTNQGLAALTSAATNGQNNSYFNNATDYAGNLIKNGGLTAAQQAAIAANRGMGAQYGQLGDNNGLTSGQTTNLKQTNSLYGQYAGLGDNNGQTAGQAGTISGLQGVNNSVGGIAAGLGGPSAAQTGYTSLYNSSGGPSLTEQQLMATATGQNLGGQDPYFQANLGRTLDNARSGVNASIGASGRYGSGNHIDTLGSTLGGISDQAYSTEYNNALNRQQQALGAIEGTRQQGFQNQFNSLGAADQARLSQINTQLGAYNQQANGLNSVYGMQQQGVGNQFNALAGQGNTANNAFNMGQQGVGNQFNALNGQNQTNQNAFNMGQQGINNAMSAGNNLGSLYQQSLLPGQTLLNAGQIQDADAQAKLNDANNIKNKDFNYLSQWQGLLSGQPEDKTKSNPWLDILGTAGSLASVFL